MAAALHRRGPDGYGHLIVTRDRRVSCRWNDGWPEARATPATVGFAHRRLAIIDLEPRSDQPLVSRDQTHALVFNGEIYNYVELRHYLERRGHTFVTSGDTEVLLNAYREWGVGCVDRLVGMWAFALLDLPQNQLVLSRDRFGIKPLFYRCEPDELLFASEIQGVLAALERTPAPDDETVSRFLIGGRTDDQQETFFQSVTSLGPAELAIVPLEKDVRISPRRYWSITTDRYDGSDSEAIAAWRERFLDSVHLHRRSDVAVGTCLSGGLDSSAIVCAARRPSASSRDAHLAFGYCAEDAQVSERTQMEVVADHANVGLTRVTVSRDDMLASVSKVIADQTEPFGSASIIVQWHVFAAAHEASMKVMLDGQGADEVLGGYHWYLPTLAVDLVKRRELREYAMLARAYHRLYPDELTIHARTMAALAGTRFRGVGGLLHRRVSPEPPTVNSWDVASEELRSHYAQSASATPRTFEELLQRQTEVESLPALLRFEDRNSMAHSIEARVPFLDHRLVDFTFSLPTSLKVRASSTKYVLREAMRDVLPEAIRTRKDKIGFRADPKLTWQWAEAHRSELCFDTEVERRWLTPGAVEALLDGAVRGTAEEFLLWRIVNVKQWARAHW